MNETDNLEMGYLYIDPDDQFFLAFRAGWHRARGGYGTPDVEVWREYVEYLRA